MNKFYVYGLIDPRNAQPFYIGKGIIKDNQGREFRRIKYHLSLVGSYNRLKNAVIKKLLKQGDEIKFKIFAEKLSEQEAFALEIQLIKQFGRRDIKTGILCNLTDGGEGVSGHKYSDEFKKKCSDRMKKYIQLHGVSFKGCNHSSESRKKMSIAQKNLAKTRTPTMKGKHHSESTKKILSKLASQRTGDKNYWFGKRLHDNTLNRSAEVCREKFKGEGNPFFGKKHSEETRARLSEVLTGRKMPASMISKTIGNERSALEYIVTSPNGRTSRIKNLSKFCREHNLFPSNAHLSIKKLQPYLGYTFKRFSQEN